MTALPTPDRVAELRRRGLALGREIEEGARTPEVRLAVLSSFNLDLLPQFLLEALDRRGLSADAATGDFGQIAQEVLNPASWLYDGEDRDLVIVPAAEDLLAGLFERPLSEEEQDDLVEARLGELSAAVSAALDRLEGSTCYVVAFGATRAPGSYLLDPTDPARGQAAIARFLDGVRALGELSPRVVVVDWDWHSRSGGHAALGDERLWYMGRMRLNPTGLAVLADVVARHVAAYRGRARKVLAVDLDGTVWGGVVGEVGVSGLTLGEEEVGLAFRDLQRELLRLHESGIVLVACSKNNREDVVEAFERHPGMLLELSHFAAERINWQDKATNLREMAAELGLGLDSFVFIDDNPVEREWVLRSLPEVAVPDLPDDPAQRPAFLRDCGLFDRIVLTEADSRRARSYADQGRRTRLRAETPSFEDFLRTLEQEVTIEEVGEALLPRAAQLCQRTNQFNLTTRRHTMADLERMLESDDFDVYAVSVSDRFGDSGTTGLAILASADGRAEIDTFLMSCRILGRRVEDALLAFVAGRAQERGARELVGRYLPTPRNGQAASFFPDRGFKPAGDGEFHLDLGQELPTMPEEMTIKVQVNA